MGRRGKRGAGLLAQNRAPSAPLQEIGRVRHAAFGLPRLCARLSVPEPVVEPGAERVDVEVDRSMRIEGAHAAVACLPKANRYCATRRIWISSVPSVIR